MLGCDGEIDGVRLMSSEAVRKASVLVWEDECIMTLRRLRMGYGFMHNEPESVPMGITWMLLDILALGEP